MKKLFVWVFLMIVILSACNSSTMSFSKIESVPDNVQDNVDSNLKLQAVNMSGEGYYIVFHSSGDVEGDIETKGETITINLNETNLQDDILKQYTYYLTTDSEHDVIDVLVNGKSTPFDNMTIQ